MYVGRFAPSPTGSLHFGSLVAAVASFLDARSHNGTWLIRIDDLDPPREVPGAADAILHTLENFHLFWDDEVLYQSARTDAYEAALAQLDERGYLFPCACSRREIADSALIGVEGPIYPGTCRNGLPAGRSPRAVRVRVDDRRIDFHDRLQGAFSFDIQQVFGDFVVKRVGGMTAYQLAVVVDDAAQQVTHVVRGSDLLVSTPRQIYLQQLLDLPTPEYLHCPVAISADGEKLSKQTQAPAIDLRGDIRLACAVLEFLGQSVPPAVQDMTLTELWEHAADHWEPDRVAGLTQRPIPVDLASR